MENASTHLLRAEMRKQAQAARSGDPIAALFLTQQFNVELNKQAIERAFKTTPTHVDFTKYKKEK